MAGLEEGRLDKIELLQSLTDAERRSIADRCRWRRFGAGEQILDLDDATNDVLFIIDGEVRVVNYAVNGRETAYAVVSAGGHVGEIAAIDGRTRSASVVALSACTIAVLPAELFNELVESHAAIASSLLRRLTEIIRNANERIAELSTVGAVQRVYREILRLSEPAPAGAAIVQALPTQQDLASKVGATRETVARALGQLVSAGVVERRGRTMLIKDRDMLAVLANPDGDAVLLTNES